MMQTTWHKLAYALSSAPSIAVLLLFASVRNAAAADDLSEIMMAGTSYARALQSVRCAADVEGKVGDKYEKVGKIEYGVQQNKIYFDDVEKDAEGKVSWSQRYTWDGKRAEDFFRSDNQTLIIYDHRVASPVMEGINILLDPFAFLLQNRNERSGSCMMFSEILNLEEWKSLAKTATIPKHEKLNGHECVVAEFKGGNLPRLNNTPYRSRVWLDVEHGFFPVQWQRISESDKILDQYTVTSLGFLEGDQRMPYPKISEFTMNNQDGQLYNKRRLTVTGVENNASISPEEFQIDPSLANTIQDSALQTTIKIDHGKAVP